MLTNYWGLKNMCKAFIPMLDPQVLKPDKINVAHI
jgi:hypothetical protein